VRTLARISFVRRGFDRLGQGDDHDGHHRDRSPQALPHRRGARRGRPGTRVAARRRRSHPGRSAGGVRCRVARPGLGGGERQRSGAAAVTTASPHPRATRSAIGSTTAATGRSTRSCTPPRRSNGACPATGATTSNADWLKARAAPKPPARSSATCPPSSIDACSPTSSPRPGWRPGRTSRWRKSDPQIDRDQPSLRSGHSPDSPTLRPQQRHHHRSRRQTHARPRAPRNRPLT
jgi:hypothetical protein